MTRQSRKRLYVFEREPQLQTLLQAELTADEALVRGFSRPHDCLETLAAKPCDLLIVDLAGGGPAGLQVLEQAGRMAPGISALAVVERAAISSALEAIKAGAGDCLEQPVPPDRLLVIVRTQLARVNASTPRRSHVLTQLEVQILQLILGGKTSYEMAADLHRSKRTIDVHRKNIMRKLHATGLADLIKRAWARGFSDQVASAQEPTIPIRSVDRVSGEARTNAVLDSHSKGRRTQ